MDRPRGLLALHGGGEFLPGDEAFLEAVLEAAGAGAGDGAIPAASPLRVAIVPTAASRGRPDLVGSNGAAAFRRVASPLGLDVEPVVVPIVDRRSADDPDLASTLATSAVIHLPGGDPDRIPALLPGTAAAAALADALRGGAVLAGASAGAMALAEWCWTPSGIVRGLGFIPRLLVVPHADAATWVEMRLRFGAQRPAGVAVLGLAERTGVLGRVGETWRVVGQGAARWLPGDAAIDAAAPLVVPAGSTLRLD